MLTRRNSWTVDDENCVWDWFGSVQAGETDSGQRPASAGRGTKTTGPARTSGWNVSFWFVAASPLLGVLLGILVLAIFYR
jgi:hypothetical protein